MAFKGPFQPKLFYVSLLTYWGVPLYISVFVNGIDDGKRESLFLLGKNRLGLLSRYLWNAYKNVKMLGESHIEHIYDKKLWISMLD